MRLPRACGWPKTLRSSIVPLQRCTLELRRAADRYAGRGHAAGEIVMTDRNHHEDVLRGVTAIAKALNVSARDVHRLHAYHGLPAFWNGRMLCAHVNELNAWRDRWQAEANGP
jgi:hypothetical protein